MRIRPSALASIVCLAFVSVACNSGNMEGEEYGVSSADTAQDLALWEPMTVQDCAEVDAFLEESGTTFASSDTDTLEIALQVTDGRLQASPGPLAVNREQTLRWHAPDLRWTLRFVGGATPVDSVSTGMASEDMAQIEGEGDMELGFSAEARVASDAACGIYHYVVAAADGDGNLYVLDPPLVVKD